MSEGVEKEFHLHRITTLLQHPAEDEYVAQEGVATPAGVSRVVCGHSHTLALCEGVLLAWGSGVQGQLLSDLPLCCVATPRILPILRLLQPDEIPAGIAAEGDRCAFLSNQRRLFIWGNGETIHEVKLPAGACEVTLAAGETIVFAEESPAEISLDLSSRGETASRSARLESREWWHPGGLWT